MWYTPKVVTPPTEPIDVAAAKKQLNVFHDDHDGYIGELISAARDHVEKYCGAAFASRDIEIEADAWSDLARLPVLPVSGITAIAYVDSDGATVTLPDTVYELRGDGIILKFSQTWPARQRGSLITVTATVGFETCPPAVRHAMLLWIDSAYENRETGEQLPWTTFDALLSNYRFYS
ncbi:hypothetical protein EET67_05165 [Pseudaminobacter arsenicus]|uniref:Phage gp6-like head-tail connector protein n=1 Tax=Borborobacter arsenicus TaxID=1851146 RepID=A0A432VA69_9HYPH|nr:head-tail connector protein [Pseudaminobacter arsenicus]RUM99030.1 hypothetical protein EET67_05165 [Pseudaminobacter arsenicus]